MQLAVAECGEIFLHLHPSRQADAYSVAWCSKLVDAVRLETTKTILSREGVWLFRNRSTYQKA
jgi:hypothetical protein